MPDPVLLIVHQNVSKTHRIGRVLEELGYRLDVRRPNNGEVLPETLDHHSATVIFGGPMSANDAGEQDGIRAELDWLPRAFDAGKPVLGACLGAQLIAKALGANVAPHPDGMAEIGYREVRPTAAGAPWFDGPQYFFQWHLEGFEVPAGAVLLAEGDVFPNQAFRYADKVIALQFHAEVRGDAVERWSHVGRKRLALPGADPRLTLLKDYEVHEPRVDRWMRRFIVRLMADD